MITELESAEGPEGPGGGGEVMSGEAEGPGRWPWRWVLGTVVATAVVGALTLQAIGYGQAASPDLHGYRVSDVSPCSGDNLQPLSRAFGPGRSGTSAMERRTSAALDQARCVFSAQVPAAGTHWQAWYTVTVTVELHKKTDPAPEFEARNRPGGPDLDTSALATTDETDRVTPVPHLGDKAYLLDGHELDHALTVLHGGAVFTVDAAAQERWAGAGAPPDINGLPQKPPGLPPLHRALVATMRRLMSAMSG